MNNTMKDGAGNTRLKPKSTLESHLDYLRIRKDAISAEEFQLIVGFIIGEYTLEFDQPWSPGAGAVFFPHKLIGTHGVVGGFNVDEEGFYYTMIDMPGGYFEGKNATDQWRLIQGLYHRYQVKCTRIDLAIDDSTYSVIPVVEMQKACEEGLNFGFRNYGTHASGQCGKKLNKTLNLGSRNSGKYCRVYDHDGECQRFEVEFKRGFAHPIFQLIGELKRENHDDSKCSHRNGYESNISSSDSWDINVQKTLASIAVGAYDFRDRGTRKDNRRAGYRDSKRIDFYQEFIDKIKVVPYRIRLQSPAKTISKTLQWVKRQCAPTLAMLLEGFGRHDFNLWVREIVENGTQRMSNQKNLWANEIARNKQLYIST